MGCYREYLLPHLVDRALSGPAVRGWREQVTAGLHGTIVEIGFGSGLNVPHYPAAVSLVYAIEPAQRARRLAEKRLAGSPAEVRHVGLDGARLPLADNSCDGALSTFTLCTIPDVHSALCELRRVLRPAATFHFLEHGAASQRSVATLQRWLDPVQRLVADGCHLTRDPATLVAEAGFVLRACESRYAVGPSPWSWMTLGVAEAP